DRAIARLLGGGDRIARINRLTYLDVVQDERVDGGIRTDPISLAALNARILPSPTDFVITNRTASARRTFAIDSTAPRNYHDLLYVPRSSSLAPKIPKRFRHASPDQLSTGFRGGFRLRSFNGTTSDTAGDTGSASDATQLGDSSAHQKHKSALVDQALW